MSSAKQSDEKPVGSAAEGASGPPVQPVVVGLLVGGAGLLFGWFLILHLNRWHFTAPVLMLFIAWGALLLTGRFLWQAAWVAANEPQVASEAEFWQPVGAREELEAEKRALLKAIKEVEFDYGMGKMSDADADELTRYYRRRAIDVIKALESTPDDDDSGDLQAQIEREIEARLELDKRRAKNKKRPAGGEADEPDADSPEESA